MIHVESTVRPDPAVAEALLAAQVDCLEASDPCAPVPIPAALLAAEPPTTPDASPVASRRVGFVRNWAS
jgi:hypothetical protein